MLDMEITPRMRGLAKEWAADQVRAGRYSASASILDGEGCLAGVMGEILAVTLIPGTSYHSTTQFDLVLPNRLKADVKSKRRTVPPQPHQNASVCEKNLTQLCDLYLFVSLLSPPDKPNRFTHGWLVGWMPKRQFLASAFRLRKGELEPGSRPPFHASESCRNIRHEKLRDPATLLKPTACRCGCYRGKMLWSGRVMGWLCDCCHPEEEYGPAA